MKGNYTIDRMKRIDEQTYKKKDLNKDIIYPVPFSIRELIELSNIKPNIKTKDLPNNVLEQANNYYSKGNLEAVANCYKNYIKLGFKDHRVLSNYGVVLQELGKIKEAELIMRKSIEMKPNYANAYLNLSSILVDLGKQNEAELIIRKSIALNPNSYKAFLNLGNILATLGKYKEAELATRKSIVLDKNNFIAYKNLANIYRIMGNLKQAKIAAKKIVELDPNYALGHYTLGIIYNHLGKEEEAKKCFESALDKSPNDIIFFSYSKLIFSTIMMSTSQIEDERRKYQAAIKEINENKNMHINKIYSFNPSMFNLAYHNKLDDKEILEDLSESISKINGIVCNDFSLHEYKKSSKNRKSLKIGICSHFLDENHTIGKLFIDVLKDLLKTDLDITIYITPETNISKSNRLRNLFKRVIELPQNSPFMAAKIILLDNLDLMFYPDIGMYSFTYLLALSRVAPVQAMGLGHPNTSGIHNIDYLITADKVTHKGTKCNTERLIRLNRLPFNYSIPKINKENLLKKTMIHSENFFKIGLTQTLFKIHPDYDIILESILKEIENSYLILVNDKLEINTNKLKNRWKNKSKIFEEKTIFLDRMSKDDFINTTKSCDIMLDPFFYGSGNTFYEAMAFGIPFITYPVGQVGGLVSSGYKQMKIDNPPVANSPKDYINWCKRYANDQLLLEETKKELIEKAKRYLFNDREIYKEYYKFFNEAVSQSKKGQLLSSNWNP